MTDAELEAWEADTEAKARELWLRLWDNMRDTGLDGFKPGVDGPRQVVADFLLYLREAGFARSVNDACEGHNGNPADIRPADYFGPVATAADGGEDD